MAYPKGKPKSEESKRKVSATLRKLPDVQCETCGKVFWASKPRRFCSRACFQASRAPARLIEYKCLRCGKAFIRHESQSGKFCSISCSTRSRTGERSSRWSGGIHYQGGYRMILQADGKYKMEHRIVMEQIIGRPMRDDETVHHINGIRDDNRPENLELWVGVGAQPKGIRSGDGKHCPTCTCEHT